MERELPIRIKIFRTLEGVALAVQRGKTELVKPSSVEGDIVTFEFKVRVVERKGGAPNFLGPFAFGTPDDRFFYVCIGTYAGQKGSPWGGRAKIKTKGITWKLVEQTLNRSGAALEAQFDGRGKDGGPSCATVPLLDGGWKMRSK